MSSDWWAKKLGTAQQQPAGIALYPTQPPAYPQYPQYPQQAPAYPQQPVQQPQQMPPGHDDPNRKLSLREAVSRFSGAEGVKSEGHLACPKCRSRTGYTAFSNTYEAGGKQPRPRCFECGYNGHFSQGEAAAWVH